MKVTELRREPAPPNPGELAGLLWRGEEDELSDRALDRRDPPSATAVCFCCNGIDGDSG